MGLLPENEIDLDNRDPTGLNSHVKVEWEDIIGEPDGVRSINCIWSWAHKCYHLGFNLSYMVATLIWAIPYAFFWGCEFATISFYHVWYLTPLIRIISINCLAIEKLSNLFLRGCMLPCVETCAHCFSKIVITSRTES